MSSVLDDHPNRKIEDIHLLLRGDVAATNAYESSEHGDEYIEEFRKNNLVAVTIPILEFRFINLESLLHELQICYDMRDETSIGLVITSPRVVRAIQESLRLITIGERKKILSTFEDQLVFVVGERTGRECQSTLGLNYNEDSAQTGSSHNLTMFIKECCDTMPSVRLLYPKGSKTDSSLEESFASLNNYLIKSVVVYDTKIRESMHKVLIDELTRLNLREQPTLTINLIFFSPSGVEGFIKINQTSLMDNLKKTLSCCNLNLRFSSIGRTTEIALIKNNLPVFSVSKSPNPRSLVNSLLTAHYTTLI